MLYTLATLNPRRRRGAGGRAGVARRNRVRLAQYNFRAAAHPGRCSLLPILHTSPFLLVADRPYRISRYPARVLRGAEKRPALRVYRVLSEEDPEKMKMLKICLNPKVLAGLVVAGVGIYLIAPNLIAAALPILLLAVCPLSMLLMMWGMQHTQGQGQQTTHEPDVGLSREERMAQLRTQQAALAEQIGELEREEAHPAEDGRGRNLAFYPAGVRLTGIDLSPAMLERARKRARELGMDVDLREGDAQDLPFPDGSFDTVVCTLALCNVPDERRAVAEMKRVLTASGRLLLLDHVRAASGLGRAVQKTLEVVTVWVEGEHLLRRPLEHVRAEGFWNQPHNRDPETDLLDHPRASRDAHVQPHQADQQEQRGEFLHSVQSIWRSSRHRLYRYFFSGTPPLLFRGTGRNPP